MIKKITSILLLLICSYTYGQKQITIILGSGTGGSGGSDLANFYLKDSTLSNSRTVDLDGNFFKFQHGGNEFLNIDPTVNAESVSLAAVNITGGGNTGGLIGGATSTEATATLATLFNGGAKSAFVTATANTSASTITHTADIQLFNAVDSIVHTADVSIFRGNVGINQNPNDNTRLLDVFNTTAGLTLLQISSDGKNSGFTAYDPTGSGAPASLNLSSDLGGTNVQATLSAADNNTSNSASIGLDGYNGTAQLQSVNGITISAGSGAAGLTFNGSVNFKSTANSFTGTLGSSVFTLECDSGPYNINLPDATTVPGRIYVIKLVDAAGDIEIVPFGAQTIDGDNGWTLDSQWEAVTLQANSVGNWSVLSNYVYIAP